MVSVHINPLSANFTKWSNTLKQNVFDQFVGLALKGLRDHLQILLVLLKLVSDIFRFFNK